MNPPPPELALDEDRWLALLRQQQKKGEEEKQSDEHPHHYYDERALREARTALPLLNALRSALENIRSAPPSIILKYLLPRHYEDIVADDDLIYAVVESVERAEHVLRSSSSSSA